MIATSDERIASAELEHLARSLRPPCQAGGYTLTGQLARSATALLYTARGPAFGRHAEGVLKLSGSMYAPILERELRLLLRCAEADLEGLVRPLTHEVLWLSAGGPTADRPAAGIALPLLSGGDLTAVARRAGRAGTLGSGLALEAARPIATALRGLMLLDQPLVHGDVRPQNVLLPTPTSELREVQLIDLDAARELRAGGSGDPSAQTDDVRGFGDLLCLLAMGGSQAPETNNHTFDDFVARCLGAGGQTYASMADDRLWRDLAAAEDAERAGQKPHGRFSPARWFARVRRRARRARRARR